MAYESLAWGELQDRPDDRNENDMWEVIEIHDREDYYNAKRDSCDLFEIEISLKTVEI